MPLACGFLSGGGTASAVNIKQTPQLHSPVGAHVIEDHISKLGHHPSLYPMAKKTKAPVTNPNKRPLPNRAPKKGDRIEYQWDDLGKVYKKGLVERGGKNTMKVKWDEEGLQPVVDVKGKEHWWFFESGNAKKRKKAWKPPALEKAEIASEDQTLTRSIPRFMKSSTEGPPPKGKHKVHRFFQRQHLKVGGPTMD
jgi:hypothetical protein